jgi:myo-inositol-1(or 4)-monophosphatase
VVVGVLYRGDPSIGVVHDPCQRDTYTAARGHGARRGAETLSVAARELGAMSLLAVRHRFLRGERSLLLESLPTRKFRCLGSLCLEMALVAAGAFGAHIAGSARLWEATAGTVLIEEAGGVVCDLHGWPVFPLAGSPLDHVDRRFGLLGGSQAAVTALAAQLRRVPL